MIQELPNSDGKNVLMYLNNIDKMRNFYSERIKIAPESQKFMFMHFVLSLDYATKCILELQEQHQAHKEELPDETRTNS